MAKKIDFKLIALRPLAGCAEQYIKLLTPDKPYYFYNNYLIDKNDHITQTESLPGDFFFESEELCVNISAIVGKNGSGKSTIIELLFMALNNLAFQQPLNQQLIPVKGVAVDIYFQAGRYYKIEARKQVQVYAYTKGKKRVKPLEDFDLKNFFYTIIVNYSQHAYNNYGVKPKEDWLKKLFHKNDGYQTPIVLNPYRREGNININSENHLVKTRLLANLLDADENGHDFRQLTPKLKATTLSLKVGKGEFYTKKLYGDENKDTTTFSDLQLENDPVLANQMLNALNTKFKFNYSILKKKEKLKLVIDYILYKMVSIAIKYDDYEGYFIDDTKKCDVGKLTGFANDLFEDTSHITFKLRQAINILKYHHLEVVDRELDIIEFAKTIAKLRPKGAAKNTVYFVPPPIFDIEIILRDVAGSSKPINFTTLSSGEKQMIYSASSLLYHLRNLDSIRNWKTRKAYSYVNVVMEEIELYFHPELQRNYIKTILDSIAKIKLNNITGINICFVTHSPFILSDIPSSNILFLSDMGTSDSTSVPGQAFGGNIHELLASVFFLENGLTGAFAQNKLQTIINQMEAVKARLITGSTVNGLQDHILKTIENVGEPFLKKVLMDKYYATFEREQKVKELREQIIAILDND